MTLTCQYNRQIDGQIWHSSEPHKIVFLFILFIIIFLAFKGNYLQRYNHYLKRCIFLALKRELWPTLLPVLRVAHS